MDVYVARRAYVVRAWASGALGEAAVLLVAPWPPKSNGEREKRQRGDQKILSDQGIDVREGYRHSDARQ